MADNNYKEGNSFEDLQVLTNPYANSGNTLKIKGIKKVDDCQFLASFGYVIAAGGATTTITPLTGNLSGDLNYYRVEVSDGSKTVANELSLAARTTAFVVDTSSLDAASAWTFAFYGDEGGSVGDAGCGFQYELHLGIVGIAGASGDSIPSDWVNVSFLLKLTSTGDANFTLFPVLGLDIAAGETVDLTQFLSTGTQLANLGSYIFTLQIKKNGTDPTTALPTVPTNDVFASFASTVTFPYAITKTFAEALNAVTIKTSVAGAFSEAMTFVLTDEGVVPSVSFTLTTDVSA